MRKHRIWYGVILVTALVIYLTANSGTALMALGALVLIPILSVGIQGLVMHSLTINCEIKASCRVKQSLPVTCTIRKIAGVPAGEMELVLEQKNVLYGEQKMQVLSLQPAGKRELIFEYRMPMTACGSMRIRALTLRCYDVLGLFCWKKKLDKEIDVLVYPVQLQLETQLSRRPETRMTGEMYDQNRKGQDVSEVVELRDYIPGDSLGRIHWKLSEKAENLIVREFGCPSDYDVLILYDMMKNYGEKPITTKQNDAVLAFTAELSYRLIERNLEHSVGRVVQGEYQASPVYSVDTQEKMVLNLLCRPMPEEGHPEETIYYFLRGNLKSQYTKLIYITPEYEEESIRRLAADLDITILQIVENGGEPYTDAGGYAVIPVDAEHYREKIHTVML